MQQLLMAFGALALGATLACSDDDGSDVLPNAPPGGSGGGAAVGDAGPGGAGGSAGGAGRAGGDAGGGSGSPGCSVTPPDAGVDAGADDAGTLDAGALDAGLADAGDDGSQALADRVSFAADIHPIFESSCGPCHVDLGYGGHNVAGELEAAYVDAVRLGQRLITRIDGGGMPPPNAAPPNDCGAQGRGSEPGDQGCLTVAEVSLVQAWIEQCFPR